MASAYERLLTDPKSSLPVGVPTFTPVDTRKTRVYSSCVIECGGGASTDQELRIQWNPHSAMANDVDVVRLVNATVVSGVAGLRSNSTYAASQFGNALRGRLVAARLDVSNISDAANGRYIACYDRSGGDISGFTGQDIASRVNEKSSVAAAAGSEDVHLLYRPHSDDERTNWVSNVNEGPFEGLRTISATTFPVAGVVTWRGNNAAGDYITLAGAESTYYQGGDSYTLYNSGSSYSLYTQGTGYALYDGTGGTISGYSTGSAVNYVTSEYGNTARSMVDTPDDMDNDFNNGSGPVPVSSNAGLGRILSNLRYECILESGETLGVLRMLQNGGYGSSNTMSYPVVYIQSDSRCKDVHLELEVVTSNGGYEWHTIYDTEHYATTSSWAAASGTFSSANGAYVFSATINGTAFIAPSSGWAGTMQPEVGWNTVFRRMKVIMSNFIDSPYHDASNYVASLPIRVQYAYRDFYIDQSTKKSYTSSSGNLIGNLVSGVDRGNAVSGTNIGDLVTGTDQGTEVNGYNRGNSTTIATSYSSVHKPQRFLLTFCGVYEYSGESVNESDRSTTPAARGPVPLRAWRSTAYSTPRKVLDSAMQVKTKTDKKRVIQDTPYGRY